MHQIIREITESFHGGGYLIDRGSFLPAVSGDVFLQLPLEPGAIAFVRMFGMGKFGSGRSIGFHRTLSLGVRAISPSPFAAAIRNDLNEDYAPKAHVLTTRSTIVVSGLDESRRFFMLEEHKSMARPSILIVENHVDTAEAVRELLEISGFSVQAVRDLRGAKESLARKIPDAIICDIGLPDGTGWDVMTDLPSPKPFGIAISGLAREVDTARSMEAGFSHHVSKPFTIEQLLALLEPLARGDDGSA